jgi:antitoxin VapB
MVDVFYHASKLVSMALNIKNATVERLAAEIAKMTGETKTEAIRRALEERKQRLATSSIEGDRATRLRAFLEREVWPSIPRGERGRRLTRKQEDAILGYGREGI